MGPNPTAPSQPMGAPGIYAAATATPVPKGNVFGMVSMILGVAVIVLNGARTVILRFFIDEDNHAAEDSFVNMTLFIMVALSVVTVALGIVGLTRKGRPKGGAGFGVGVGAAMLILIAGARLVWL